MRREDLLHYLTSLDVRVDNHQSRQNKIVGYCPYARFTHESGEDRRPSFAAFVNDAGLSGFLCMACRKKGTIHYLITSLSRLTGNDYNHLLEEVLLSEEYGLTHFDNYEEALAVKSRPVVLTPLDEAMYKGVYPCATDSLEAREYINNRGISDRTIKDLGLLYDPEEMRVLFEVRRRRDKRLYGYTGRAVYPSAKIKVKDYAGLPKRNLILGEHRFTRGNPVLIVEGLFGYAWLHEIGAEDYFNIGAIMGSVLTPEKADTLIEFGEPVYLLLDNDGGGELGTFGTGENGDNGAVGLLINQIPLFVPLWPDGKTDPDQLTLDEVVSMLRETPPFTPQDIC